MKEAVEIQLARPKDLKVWAKLCQALWPKDPYQAHLAEVKGLLARKSKAACYLAWVEGEVIGFGEVSKREFANGCDTAPVAFLEGIYVFPRWRRKGIGRALVGACEAWARKKGLKEMGSDSYLDAKLSAKSHQGWGFKETERVIYWNKKLERP